MQLELPDLEPFTMLQRGRAFGGAEISGSMICSPRYSRLQRGRAFGGAEIIKRRLDGGSGETLQRGRAFGGAEMSRLSSLESIE